MVEGAVGSAEPSESVPGGSSHTTEWLESGRIHAEDVYLELLWKESCSAALEGKSLAR